MRFSPGLTTRRLEAAVYLASVVVWLGTVGCSEIETRPGCPDPGETRACACDGGGTSEQICQADRVWQDCTCIDTDADDGDSDVDANDGGQDLDADDVGADLDADDPSADLDADDPSADPDVVDEPDADLELDVAPVDECELGLDDCADDADCTDTEDGYACACRSGFVGNGVECFEGVECDPESSICDAHAACLSFEVVFLCVCNEGYSGDGVTACTNVDECDSPSLNDCDGNADCADTEGSYECTCRPGFSGDGTECSDIDECSIANPCGAGTCGNAVPGYTCACDPGYASTGGPAPMCVAIDECAEAIDPCGVHGSCFAGGGPGYECVCDAGYVASSGLFPVCVDRNECDDGSHSCGAGGTCENGGGFGYDCLCTQGYRETVEDFPTCEVINECDEVVDPCGQDGVCTGGGAVGYACVCDPGYEEIGAPFPTCEPIDECATATHQCAPNGTCENGGGFGYDCLCNRGYIDDGEDFSQCVDEDECRTGNHACGADGECRSGDGFGYDCECASGYYATDEDFPACLSECAGQPDLTRCDWTNEDRYCFGGTCLDWACGTAACNPGGPHFALADTGQRDCYDGRGEPVECCLDGGTEFCGQDAEFGLDLNNLQRFTLDGPTVRDRMTGLHWTRCPLGRLGSTCVNGSNLQATWGEAVTACRTASVGGYTNWRLPDRYELASLLNHADTSLPYIDTAAFTTTAFDWMWSSSSSAVDAANAWAVRQNSQVTGLPKTDLHDVRCVRGLPEPLPTPRYTDDAGGPLDLADTRVVDRYTRLMWTRPQGAMQASWQAGLAYCDGLSDGGHDDWRLPNAHEVETLVDVRLPTHADLTVFPGAGGFFSGTHGGSVGLAFLTSTANGNRLWNGALFPAFARCVRELPPQPNRVFTTSSGYRGDLVGEANALVHAAFTPADAQDAADAICQWHANQAGLGGRYVAGLSTVQSGFLEELSDADGPWALVDGSPVTTQVSAFVDGRLITALELDEQGNPVPDDRTAWTGGTLDCSGWTSSIGNGIYGSPTSVGASFRAIGNPGCGLSRRLYCVEVGPGAGALDLPELPSDALLAFTTSFTRQGNFASGGGVHAVGDGICQLRAEAVGRGGTWRAWVSSSTVSALDHLAAQGMDGPWYREDGFLFANSRNDLVDADGPTGHLNIDESGVYILHTSSVSERVWTGTGAGGEVSENCTNFSSLGGIGRYGRATTSAAAWTAEDTRPCDESLRFICLQEAP